MDAAPQWAHLVGGVVAGGVPCGLLHPLDTLKTRMQMQGAAPQQLRLSMRRTAYNMLAKEGIAAFYRGLAPALVGNCTAWGLYLFLYNAVKIQAAQIYNGPEDTTALPPAMNFLCGVCAGVVTTCATNPIWLVKTRLQLQWNRPATASLSEQYRYDGMRDAFRKIVKVDGVRGLWRGIGPALLLVSHGSIQFTIYDELKRIASEGGQKDLTAAEAFCCGAFSKICAQVITYPSQLIKTRLQDVNNSPSRGDKAIGFSKAVRRVFKHEGAAGFYKGLTPALLRVVPSSALTLLTYEMCVKVMK